MLNIFYGDMKEAVYNTAAYFKYDYEDNWITDPFVKKMIKDVDQSIVLDSGVIDSPVLGKIPPTGLSGGVKTWGSKFYSVRWSDVYQLYVDNYLNIVFDIIDSSKTFGDIRDRFVKDLSYLEFINFGIKNKYIQ